MNVAPYASWKSPVTSDLIVAQSIGLSEVRIDGGDLYWLESRPQEAGRSVIVRQRPGGAAEDVTPPPFNIRTRVHEYGGGAGDLARAVEPGCGRIAIDGVFAGDGDGQRLGKRAIGFEREAYQAARLRDAVASQHSLPAELRSDSKTGKQRLAGEQRPLDGS